MSVERISDLERTFLPLKILFEDLRGPREKLGSDNSDGIVGPPRLGPVLLADTRESVAFLLSFMYLSILVFYREPGKIKHRRWKENMTHRKNPFSESIVFLQKSNLRFCVSP